MTRVTSLSEMRPFLLAVSLLAAVAVPQSKPLGQFNVNRLREKGLVAYLPTYLPKGFRLTHFTIEDDAGPEMKTYTAVYENGKKGLLIVQSASDGLGDAFFDLADGEIADPTGTITARNKALGKIEVEVCRKGKYNLFHNQWLELKGKELPQFLMLYGENLSQTDIKKVYASLVQVR